MEQEREAHSEPKERRFREGSEKVPRSRSARHIPSLRSRFDAAARRRPIHASPPMVAAGARLRTTRAAAGEGVYPSVGSSVRKNIGAHDVRGSRKDVLSFHQAAEA